MASGTAGELPPLGGEVEEDPALRGSESGESDGPPEEPPGPPPKGIRVPLGPGVPRPRVNHLLLPVRGPCRPGLRKILSEPSLRTDFYGKNVAASSADPHRATLVGAESLGGADSPGEYLPEYRAGLADLFATMDAQTKWKEKERRRVRAAEQVMLRGERERLANARETVHDPVPWSPCDPPGYFEQPKIDNTESPTLPAKAQARHTENPAMKTLEAGWSNDYCNDKGQMLAEFGTKAYHRLGPTERRFADKLAATLSTNDRLMKQDAKNKTSGAYKRSLIRAASDVALSKNSRDPWKEPRKELRYFQRPQVDEPGTTNKPALRPYIEQPDRTNNGELGFICASMDGKKSHWHPPVGKKVAGSVKLLTEAKVLIAAPGCPSLLPREAEGLSPKTLKASRGHVHFA